MILGIDGLNLEMVQDMPFLKELSEKNNSGKMLSCVPHSSSTAWTSMTTGKNPGKTGIYYFIDNNRKLYTAKDVKVKRFWEILNKKSIIINVPLTYPPQENEKITILSSLFTPENKKPTTKDLDIDPYYIDVFDSRLKGNKLKKLYTIIKRRFEIATKLKNEQEWDIFMLTITSSDALYHKYWSHKNKIKKFNQELDSKIKEFLKNHTGHTLIISDHGFEKRRGIIDLYKIFKKNKIKAKICPANGIYTKDDQEDKKILDILTKIKGIKEIHTREKIYRGSHVKMLPKFILDTKGYKIDKTRRPIPRICHLLTQGKHKREGMFISNFIKGRKEIDIYDVTPTILGLYKKKEKDMDGKDLNKTAPTDNF